CGSSLLVVVVALAELGTGALCERGGWNCALAGIGARSISDPRTAEIAADALVTGHLGSHYPHFRIQVNPEGRTAALRRMGAWGRVTARKASRNGGSARGRRKACTRPIRIRAARASRSRTRRP